MAAGAAENLSAGELARLTGVSTDTLRHYERKGLLLPPPRTSGGYRRYPSSAVSRVRLIQRALVIGFSLDDLARVMRHRASGGAPCRQVRDIVRERLVALEQQLSELEVLKKDLQTLLADWDAQLDRTPAGQRAHLLDALATNPGLKTARATPVVRRSRRS